MQKNHQKSGFVQFCYSFGLLFYSIIIFFRYFARQIYYEK